MRNVCLQAYRNNRMLKRSAYYLRKIQTLRANNSRILSIQNAKFSGYHFSINTDIWRDFQICISVPLRIWEITVFQDSVIILMHWDYGNLWVKTRVSYEIMIMKRQVKISRAKWRALLSLLFMGENKLYPAKIFLLILKITAGRRPAVTFWCTKLSFEGFQKISGQ